MILLKRGSLPFFCSKHSILLCNTILLRAKDLTMAHWPYSTVPPSDSLNHLLSPPCSLERSSHNDSFLFFFEPSKHDPISKPFCRYLFPLPRILIPHTTAWLSTSPSSNLCSNLSFQWHLPWWPYSKSHPSLPPELSSALYCSIFLYGTLHLHTYYVVYWILCISTFCLIPLEHKLLVSRGFCLFHVPSA